MNSPDTFCPFRGEGRALRVSTQNLAGVLNLLTRLLLEDFQAISFSFFFFLMPADMTNLCFSNSPGFLFQKCVAEHW